MGLQQHKDGVVGAGGLKKKKGRGSIQKAFSRCLVLAHWTMHWIGLQCQRSQMNGQAARCLIPCTHTHTHRRIHAHDFRLTIGNRADFAALNGCYRYPFRLYFMIKLLTAMAERFIDWQTSIMYAVHVERGGREGSAGELAQEGPRRSKDSAIR